jgi:hypothetical protein
MLRGALSSANNDTQGCSHSILRSMTSSMSCERRANQPRLAFSWTSSTPWRHSKELNNAPVLAASAGDPYGGPSRVIWRRTTDAFAIDPISAA